MFLVDDNIIEAILPFLGEEVPVKCHAILSPNMKVIPIESKLPYVLYTPSAELQKIVSDIIGKDNITIDKEEKYRYNSTGQHRITAESDGIHVYYSYVKEIDGV